MQRRSAQHPPHNPDVSHSLDPFPPPSFAICQDIAGHCAALAPISFGFSGANLGFCASREPTWHCDSSLSSREGSHTFTHPSVMPPATRPQGTAV
eukprot:scaffold1557_cov246-Pinguiococcus_pyrenoidosus.AAC.14